VVNGFQSMAEQALEVRSLQSMHGNVG